MCGEFFLKLLWQWERLPLPLYNQPEQVTYVHQGRSQTGKSPYKIFTKERMKGCREDLVLCSKRAKSFLNLDFQEETEVGIPSKSNPFRSFQILHAAVVITSGNRGLFHPILVAEIKLRRSPV